MGEISEIRLSDGTARYDPKVGPDHHHLVCEGCGLTFDVEPRGVPGLVPAAGPALRDDRRLRRGGVPRALQQLRRARLNRLPGLAGPDRCRGQGKRVRASRGQDAGPSGQEGPVGGSTATHGCGSEIGRRRVPDHLEDVVPDQLLAVRAGRPGGPPPRSGAPRASGSPRPWTRPGGASTSARPSSLASTLETMPPAGYSMAADEISVVPMPSCPTIWQAFWVAAWRSLATPVEASPKNSSSATMPPKAMSMSARTSDLVLVKRSSSSEWLSRPERVLALDDGEHLELAALAHQPGHRGVAGLVGGDGPALGLGVLDRLGQPDLLGHLGVLEVVPREAGRRPGGGPTPATRPCRCSIITGE